MRKLVLAALAILASGGMYVACAQQAQKPAPAPTPIPAQSRPANSPAPDPTIKETGGPATMVSSPFVTQAPLKSDFVLGKRNAPVVMVEYASLSCPHCAHFSTDVLPAIEKKYIDTGKLAYVLRQFPLNEPAMRAAMLVYCVGAQSEAQYYVYNRVLFDSQNRWAFDSNFMEGLKTIAGVGGMAEQNFKNCVSNKELETKVLQDKKAANDDLKIPYTPYIIIDGEVYKGDHTAEAVSKFIDGKLAAKARK